MYDNIHELVQTLKSPKIFFLFLSPPRKIIIFEMKEEGGGLEE